MKAKRVNKRVIALVLGLTMLVVGGTAFAATWGIGGAFGIDFLGGLPTSAMVTAKIPGIPMVIGLGGGGNNNYVSIGTTIDWWFLDTNLSSALMLYVGPGLYMNLMLANGDVQYFALGGRVPIGLHIYPFNFLELFLEVAPSMQIIGQGGVSFGQFALQGGFGFRFWFNR